MMTSLTPSSPRRAARPRSGAAPSQGGKRNLARRIVARIAAIPHRTYAEPFVGMGGVFFRRPDPAPAEVINDRSRDVATFFRVLQRHYVPFLDVVRWQLTTRAEFERLVRTDPDTLTDLERAARFYYLQRTSFGGKVRGRTFGVAPGTPGRFDLTKLAPQLEELHTRLAGVVIECLPFGEFLTRYDREATLFYLDPPYYGCESDYGRDLFTRDDFARLAEQLRTLRGQFILSLNDHPAVREIFAGFTIEAVRTTYSVSGGRGASEATEVLITGAAPDGAPQPREE
jgi:DNA adenine methylase